MVEPPIPEPPIPERPDPDDAPLVDAAWRQVAALVADDAAGADEAPALPGYRVLRRLHRGGQGTVYQALDERTGRKVALKVLRGGPLRDGVAAARFEREVRVLEALDHPSVVRVHASGSAGASAWFVMDYVPGRPIDEHVAAEELSVRAVVALVREACEALGAAHALGVVHRDLKPGNVLIDVEGRPRILDFGLAKLAEDASEADELTVTGQFVGSLPWASPEQVEGRPDEVGVRSDVYALGVLLYQLLTGAFPYPVVGAPREVARNVARAEPRRPRTLEPRVDDELETIVLRCLAKEPERRYPTAGELARELGRYLAGEPIEAKRDSAWYLVRKAARRHPVAAASTTFGVALVLVVAVALALANRREAALRSEAERQARIAHEVRAFLTDDLLGAARPDAGGAGVTVREVLDTAAERVEGRFEDEPAVEAALRATLGETYMHLGDWDEADAHLVRALELSRAVSGDEARETLAALDLLARLRRRQARYEEADALHAEMLATARRVLGPEDELTLRGTSNAAITSSLLGRWQEAIERNGAVLAVRTRLLGEDHPDTLTSRNNQAHYLYQERRFDEARALHEGVLAARLRLLGPDHPDTLVSRNNLAIAYGSLGRPVEQERQLVAALEAGRAVYGNDHPQLVGWRLNLGACLRAQGRLDEAEAELLEGLAQARRLGEDHPRVGTAHVQLAELARVRGLPGEVERHARAAHEVLERKLGADHVETEDAELLLVRLLRDAERWDEALAPLLARHARYLERFGPDHPRTLHVADNVRSVYEQSGRPELAARYAPKGEER